MEKIGHGAGLVGVLVFVLATALVSGASAQEAAPDASSGAESPVWFGVGAGLASAELRVGFRDALGEDTSLRLDGFYSLYPTTGSAGGGAALHVLYTPLDAGFRPYVGGGLEVAHVEDAMHFCIWTCEPPAEGVYVGGSLVAGFERGSQTARFFTEVGISVSALATGNAQAASIELRPRLIIGVNFL